MSSSSDQILWPVLFTAFDRESYLKASLINLSQLWNTVRKQPTSITDEDATVLQQMKLTASK